MRVETFDRNGQEVRACIKDKGEIMWSAKDLCVALGLHDNAAQYYINRAMDVTSERINIGRGPKSHMLSEVDVLNFLASIDKPGTGSLLDWTTDKTNTLRGTSPTLRRPPKPPSHLPPRLPPKLNPRSANPRPAS